MPRRIEGEEKVCSGSRKVGLQCVYKGCPAMCLEFSSSATYVLLRCCSAVVVHLLVHMSTPCSTRRKTRALDVEPFDLP